MLGNSLMGANEAFKLVLGLVERRFEHVILFTLLPDSVLQFRLLVKKFVPLFDKFDFVLSIGGISLR